MDHREEGNQRLVVGQADCHRTAADQLYGVQGWDFLKDINFVKEGLVQQNLFYYFTGY